mgnify:CR=1 FL=1
MHTLKPCIYQDIISKDEYHYLFNAIETARTLDLSLKMEEILNKV